MAVRTDMKVLCFAVAAGAGSLACAHHGWSWYGNEDFSLTATVVEKQFGNPHDRLTVEADGERWTLLLSPPNRSERAGLTEELVEVGDTVTAHGHRRESGDQFEMKTERLEVDGKLYNLYPDRS
ncbi:MAG: DUF6152 family protein [Pseudomonadota bacterium]|nr:DUF6152 family protein [Pseudomonadota bacterium]